jgi:ribosomal 50S subunit-recycling heat shock protein
LKPKTGHGDNADDAAMWLDKLLWYLRLARTRGVAQDMVAAGSIRIDGRRADRASVSVRPGSLLVLPGPPRVRVLRLVHLPLRRGPPSEAASCYVDIAGDGGAPDAGPA